MKIAIVGSSGYISQYLIPIFKQNKEIESIIKIGKDESSDFNLDLLKAELFDYNVLNNVDFIAFTAAISSPDQCTKDFETCWKINVFGTKLFINEAIKRNCHVLFFSSDAVFGDIPGKIYDEHSVTAANTSYGIMKKEIEDSFRGSMYFKAIRLSYVASCRDKFITYCLNCMKNEETAEVFHPFYRNVIVISDVAEVVAYLIFHWDAFTPQFLNVAGNELISRIRIADELNNIYNNRLKYKVITPQEDFFINRPRITQMKSIYLNEFKILKTGLFTEKIKQEMKGIII